eukprot:3752718-Heterocapsa_arctica.AAC.1
MNGNQVRDCIVEKANIYWSDIFEFDTDGEEFIYLLCETTDKKQWGGARQVAIFANMENLLCNIQIRGAQPNHYDQLHPIEEEAKQEKSFKEKFIEYHDVLRLKCNIDANHTSHYIGRRSKDEVESGTTITTLNVSGSHLDFEWILENTEDQI